MGLHPTPLSDAGEAIRWGNFGHHYSSPTGYNFLSLSLAFGMVKHQSIVARTAFSSDSHAPTSLATIAWLANHTPSMQFVRSAFGDDI